jgi:hypothetical protein
LTLIAIVIFLGYRSYGDAIISWFRQPDAQRDIIITRAEFRPELEGAKPAWIIGFRNNSRRFTYDDIQLEATYMDHKGTVLEIDKLMVKQKLLPGDEKLIGSVDFRTRGDATQGRLKVLGAERID